MTSSFQKCRISIIAWLMLMIGSTAFARQADFYPASDPKNEGKWQLSPEVSDEFETDHLDETKWLIQGTDGVYKSDWIGRAPSQFSTGNVRVEDGKLKLQTRWEPDFEFSKKRDMSWDKTKDTGGTAYENITSAAVICKNEFLHGYMEIKCKAADASVTSAFWMTGNKAELDIFEHLGRPAQKHKKKLETEIWSSIHDWSKKGGPTTWTDRLQLDFRVAGGFHVYGLDWNKDYLKFYADGKLIRTVKRERVGDEGWVITGPMSIWVDSETFPWHGIPVEADLPVDYEIEYIRVWQTETMKSEQAAAAKQRPPAKQAVAGTTDDLLSFEKPVMIEGKQQSWWIAPDSSNHFSIAEGRSSSGKKALKFTQTDKLPNNVTAFAPLGSIKTAAGKHKFSMKVWLEPNPSVKTIRVIFQDPWLQLTPFDVSNSETGKWITLTSVINRNTASGPKDRPRIVIKTDDTTDKPGTLYIDELSIEKE